MDPIRRLFRLSGREPALDADVDTEIETHLALKADALVRAGWRRADAEAEARRQFGSLERVARETRAEAARGVRRRRWVDRADGWITDVRHAARSLWRDPTYTAAAALILGLGIGASLAVLAVADRLFFRPLPFAEADRLVLLLESNGSGGLRLPSYPTVRDWQVQADVLESIAYAPGTQVAWRRESGVETILAAFPTPELFDAMRVAPLLGRGLTPADEAEAARVAVLSHAFWQRRLGGDPDVIGSALSLTDGPVTIVGVMPPGVQLPRWANLYLPFAAMPPSLRAAVALRGNHADSQVLGRLAPGVSLERARAAMRVVAQRLASAYPEEQEGWEQVEIVPIRDFLANPSSMSAGPASLSGQTVVLFGSAVLLILLVSCANVASLTLVRGRARERELCIRAAIGAGRSALARRLLLESLGVATLGAGLGLALAAGLLRLVQRVRPDLVPRLTEVELDGRIVAITIGLAVLAAVGSGLMPALRSTRTSLAGLVQGAVRATGTMAATRAQRGLVTAQLAVAVTLLIGAAVLLRSFVRVMSAPLGFEPAGLVSVSIHPSDARYPNAASVVELYRRLAEAVEQVPGVDAAAITNFVPLSGASLATRVLADGQSADDARRQPTATFRAVSPDYFAVMGMPVARGRGFTDADLSGPNGGLVINQALARQLWPGQDPLGRRITIFKSARWLPDFREPIHGAVIGVVGDVSHFGPEIASPGEVYLPFTWNPWRWTGLVARVRGEPAGSVDAIWRAIAAVDPDLPVHTGAGSSIVAFDAMLAESRAPRRFVTGVAAGMAGATLLLAIAGLYGVMAYQVGLRRREIGIRGALGATPSHVIMLVMRQGLAVAAVGIVLGLVGGWFAASLLRTLVFDVPPRDILAFAAVPVLLLVVAAVAVYAPARRASRVDPVEVLKAD